MTFFHIIFVIFPKPISTCRFTLHRNGGLWMITRPIWKRICFNLYLNNDTVYHSRVPRENHRLQQVTDILSYNVVSSTPSNKWELNSYTLVVIDTD